MSKKITDLKTLKAHHAEIRTDLAAVLKKYGIEIVGSGASIGKSEIKFTIKGILDSVDHESIAREEYARYAPMFGLPLDKFGVPFTMGRESYKIVKLQLNKRKNAIGLERVSDGKKFQCSPEALPFYIDPYKNIA